MGAPAANLVARGAFLAFGVRLQHELPDALLGRGIGDRTEQRERTPLAIHGLLAGGKANTYGGGR